MKFFRKIQPVIFGLLLTAVTVTSPAPNLFYSLPDNSVPGIINFIIKILLGVSGVIAMLFIIIGGLRYVTSAGNDEQAAQAKKTLTNAIIGLVIIILSYVIVVVVINALKSS